MGYTTDFIGRFKFNKKLKEEDQTFLTKLNETRRMKRELGPQYGIEGEFFVDGEGFMGQDDDKSVLNHNVPPKTQPGLWCQWKPSPNGEYLEWDEGEKFYSYVAWLEYLIKYLTPKGYVLSGTVRFQGEESDDSGFIIVENNKVKTQYLNDLTELRATHIE